MHTALRSVPLWTGAAIVGLLLAFAAYGGNEQGWMTNGVAVPLTLIGVLVFAGATVMVAHGRRSRQR